jgi:hypothetical protein
VSNRRNFSGAIFTVLFLIGTLLSSVPVIADDATTTIPRNVVVPIVVTKDIRVGGYGANTEEKKVEFEVAQDVIVGGYVVARKGDLVEGHYTNQRNETKRVFSTDISEELALDIDDFVNFCGDTVHLKFERTFVGGARGGAFSLGAHAHDAVFAKGLILESKTDRLQKNVCAESTTATPAPLPQNMVVPDEEVSPEPSSSGTP